MADYGGHYYRKPGLHAHSYNFQYGAANSHGHDAPGFIFPLWGTDQTEEYELRTGTRTERASTNYIAGVGGNELGGGRKFVGGASGGTDTTAFSADNFSLVGFMPRLNIAQGKFFFGTGWLGMTMDFIVKFIQTDPLPTRTRVMAAWIDDTNLIFSIGVQRDIRSVRCVAKNAVVLNATLREIQFANPIRFTWTMWGNATQLNNVLYINNRFHSFASKVDQLIVSNFTGRLSLGGPTTRKAADQFLGVMNYFYMWNYPIVRYSPHLGLWQTVGGTPDPFHWFRRPEDRTRLIFFPQPIGGPPGGTFVDTDFDGAVDVDVDYEPTTFSDIDVECPVKLESVEFLETTFTDEDSGEDLAVDVEFI